MSVPWREKGYGTIKLCLWSLVRKQEWAKYKWAPQVDAEHTQNNAQWIWTASRHTEKHGDLLRSDSLTALLSSDGDLLRSNTQRNTGNSFSTPEKHGGFVEIRKFCSWSPLFSPLEKKPRIVEGNCVDIILHDYEWGRVGPDLNTFF